jgi:hypothetical protein
VTSPGGCARVRDLERWIDTLPTDIPGQAPAELGLDTRPDAAPDTPPHPPRLTLAPPPAPAGTGYDGPAAS